METEQTNQESTLTPKKPSKVWGFIKKNKYYAVLTTLLIVSIIWHFASVYFLKAKFENQKSTIEKTYQIKLDSLNTDRLQLTAKTFSWAIRSELLRNNSEQINQFFNDFIKIDAIEKLQYINVDSNIIEISTDKKDEGIEDVKYISLTEQQILQDSTSIELATPIAGLNNQIGVFVMKVKKVQ